MPTLAQLNARRESLKAALASGSKSVQHGDTRVEYRSPEEILQALSDVELDIEEALGGGVIRSYKLTSSKDY